MSPEVLKGFSALSTFYVYIYILYIMTFCTIVVKSPKVWLPINQQIICPFLLIPPAFASLTSGWGFSVSPRINEWTSAFLKYDQFQLTMTNETTGTSFLSRILAMKQLKLPCWLQHQGSWAQLETQRGRLPPQSQVSWKRLNEASYPVGSMYGVSTYIWLILYQNVGKNTIHGSYGYQIVNKWTFPLVFHDGCKLCR